MTVDFRSTPHEPFALQARVVQLNLAGSRAEARALATAACLPNTPVAS